jgi:hypothetical protein
MSEYLAHTEDIDLDEITKRYNPPIEEDYQQMLQRVWEHNDDMEKYNTQGLIWVITHSKIQNRIAYCIGYKIRKNLPHLGAIIISEIDEEHKEYYNVKCQILVNDTLKLLTNKL